MMIKAVSTFATVVLATMSLPALAETEADMDGMAEAIMSFDGSAESAEAPGGWHTCDVIRTGAGWGNHYIALTCSTGPFTNSWHILDTAQKDAMLATALAAATSNKQVQVNILVQSGYNKIRALYWHK